VQLGRDHPCYSTERPGATSATLPRTDLGCHRTGSHREGYLLAEPKRSPESNLHASGAPAVVLVVDDEESVRTVVSRTLRRYGYEVLEAPDALAALALLSGQHARVRLVLTDDTMPGMHGHELTNVIARVYPALPVVLMSGNQARFSHPPRDDTDELVLSKPFTITGLLAKVRQALGEE
jgi:CheY-like chemotaxis protein